LSAPRLPDPPDPPDPNGVRAALRLRHQMGEVSERIAALDGERATLVEVRERLRADERSRRAMLDSARLECAEVERLLGEEARRSADIETEIRAAREENAALESAVLALEHELELAEREARTFHHRLATGADQRSAAEAALASAHGALARMQYRLRQGFGTEVAPPPGARTRKS
jgi:chromosome segregation ATPase